MIKVIADDLMALKFLEARGVFPDRATFMGAVFVRDGAVIGAGGVDCMIGGIEAFRARYEATLHGAGKMWMREPLGKFFGWLFDEVGFRRLSSQVAASNVCSIRFTEKLGFRREGVRRGATPEGEDAVMFGCLPSDFRFRRL